MSAVTHTHFSGGQGGVTLSAPSAPPVQGSLTADGSPGTVINDSTWNEFPGAARLDATHILLVYRGDGTSHAANGKICGQILTLNAGNTAVTSVGTKFTILDHAEDLRLEDAVSVIDDQIVVAFRYYDGSDNHDPSIIICDDAPSAFTSSSTWSSPIPLPDPGGSVQEYTQGHVQKLTGGTYILCGGFDSGGFHTVGVWRWTGSVDDPSAATFVNVYQGTGDYSEMTLEELDDGTLRVLARSDNDRYIDTRTSTTAGATWSSNADAYDGHGNPMFRQLQSGLVLTVYRQAPNGDTCWRQSTDDGATWSSETVLDTTGTRSAYATVIQTTANKVLCVYAIEYSGSGATGTADLFYQFFTDSSTF